MSYATREEWYVAAAEQIGQQVFKPAGYELPKFRIGCGWASRNGAKTGAICYSHKASEDGTYEIFISPIVADPFEVLQLLVHEFCHTIAGLEAGHKKPFIEIMQTVGMVRPWKSSIAGESLAAPLAKIGEKLGPYPHAKLTLAQSEKKQTTRLVKVKCPKCEYVARVTRKWLDEVGGPLCPVHKVAFQEAKKSE